ncbi:hypothetical protein GCM10023238_15000 [Streptomyces heliomycini]
MSARTSSRHFVAEFEAAATPGNPCLRCNEKSKFAASAGQGAGARLRRGLHRHYAQVILRARTAPRELHRAPTWPRTLSYVLGVLDDRQLATTCSPSATRSPQEGDTARRPSGADSSVGKKPDSH